MSDGAARIYNNMSDQKQASKIIQRKNQREYQLLKFDSGTGSLKEVKFEPADCKKSFYRLIEENGLGLCVKQGFKIFDVARSEEPLVKCCLRLLESEAGFPLRIFTLEQENQEMFKTNSKKMIKSIWLQAKIVKSSQSTNQGQEKANNKLQINLHRFFIDQLLPKIQLFIKNYLTHEALFYSNDIEDQDSIMEKFREQVISGVNQKFGLYLDADSLEK